MTCGVAPTRRIPRPALFQRAPVRQATRPAPTGGDCGVAEEGTGAICAMPEVLKASEAPGVALVVSMVAEFKRAGATGQRYEDLKALRLEQAGGLMSYSPDRSELWRRGAGYVDRVLSGAKSADLVVQEPNEIRPIIASFRKLDIAAKDTGLGEAISMRQPLPIPDLTKRPSNPLRDAVIDAGLRASLIVPLLSSEGPLGTLVLQRRQPGDFPQAVINLMQALADQSAIALENARLFEEIARKSRELEITSQHKSQFVANMSHELRTPLAAMLGYAELLRDGMFGELPEKSVRIIDRMQANGKHLLGLINTVLDISKVESGQFNLNLGEYSLDSMVETVRLATESLASAKQLSFRTEVVKGLPYGLGDEPRLTQVLLNLVGNAIKFTDAGDVCISADARNGSFVVSVSDTGPGIPDEERGRIFDKFHQVDSTSTKTKGGTGLGLAIAKEIIEMHGGRIWVESILGRGSTFRMELPVRPQASGAAG